MVGLRVAGKLIFRCRTFLGRARHLETLRVPLRHYRLMPVLATATTLRLSQMSNSALT